MRDASTLDHALSDTIAMLASANEQFWVETLTRLQGEISHRPSRPAALAELRSLYGGMGSLNDILICHENKNVPNGLTAEQAQVELDRLLGGVFAQAESLLPPRRSIVHSRLLACAKRLFGG